MIANYLGLANEIGSIMDCYFAKTINNGNK
jgi:hypothetical protein